MCDDLVIGDLMDDIETLGTELARAKTLLSYARHYVDQAYDPESGHPYEHGLLASIDKFLAE